MAEDVKMPQMGESIAEGTITKWLKSVGDEVEQDEPLFEISTDKVDAEIPAPYAGVLTEILVDEGETVEVDTVVARIGEEGEASGDGSGASSSEEEEEEAPAEEEESASEDEEESGEDEDEDEDQDQEITADDASGEGEQVIMPQMGESIAEGTITKWLKSEGDAVERDEPLFEISTDKVDAEIPAPADGTLTEILVGEGETVEVGTAVARIGGAAGKKAGGGKSASGPEKKAGKKSEKKKQEKPKKKEEDQEQKKEKPSGKPASGKEGESSREERIRTKSSPVVRKIADEHGVDITEIEGTGIHGRVTKQDILAHIEEQEKEEAPAASKPAAKPQEGERAPAQRPAPAAEGEGYVPSSGAMMGVSGWPARTVQGYLAQEGENDRVETLSNMRKKIAEHMVVSKALSPHVHTLYEVDMSQVDRLRKAHKESFVQASGGAKLTYTVFMVKAVVDALKALPQLNASLVDDKVLYHGDINVGMAVALDWGLIVPVIKRAQDLSMTGIARAITDLATRARDKKLDLEEIQGSTFSITNPGSYGGLAGFPIISQPNVAILSMGKVEKRVCVVDDSIAIRPKMFITLAYDHRLVDGAVAEQFLSRITQTLENFDETAL